MRDVDGVENGLESSFSVSDDRVSCCIRRCAAYRSRDRSTWSQYVAACCRLLLTIFNMAMLVFGVICIAIGFTTFVDGKSNLYTDIVRHVPSAWPLFIADKLPQTLFAVGSAMSLFGFLGFYGACTGSVSSLWMYSVLLFAALAGELIAVSLLSTRQDKILRSLETVMQQQITYEYNRTALPSNATSINVLLLTWKWNVMQIKLNCCGAIGPQDYRYSSWFNHTKSREGVFVPPTCCTLLNDDPDNPIVIDEDVCQIDAILFPTDKRRSSVLKTRGCCDLAVGWFHNNSSIIVITVFIIINVQLIHVVYACLLLTRLRRSVSDYQWNLSDTYQT